MTVKVRDELSGVEFDSGDVVWADEERLPRIAPHAPVNEALIDAFGWPEQAGITARKPWARTADGQWVPVEVIT